MYVAGQHIIYGSTSATAPDRGGPVRPMSLPDHQGTGRQRPLNRRLAAGKNTHRPPLGRGRAGGWLSAPPEGFEPAAMRFSCLVALI